MVWSTILNVSRNTGIKFFNLLDKHFPKVHKIHRLFNLNNFKVSYNSPPNFKKVINGHNKNILCQQEKPSPCIFSDKTSYPLNNSCHHEKKLYSCNVSNPNVEHNHPYYTGLTEYTFNVIILASTSQREIEQNFLL